MDRRKLANDVLNGLPRAKLEKPRPDAPGRSSFGDSYSPALFAVVLNKGPEPSDPASVQPGP